MGWSSQAASLDLGTDKWGFGFGGTGMKSHNRQFDKYGEVSGCGLQSACVFSALGLHTLPVGLHAAFGCCHTCARLDEQSVSTPVLTCRRMG